MPKNNNFLSWYNDKFGSGQNVAVYSSAETEIENTAATAGVNWGAVKNKVNWTGKAGKHNANSTGDLLKGHKNSVGIYCSYEKTNSGIEYPLITFATKGSSAGSIVFNGLQFLYEEYEHDGKGKVDPEKKKKWEAEKRRREDEAKQIAEAARIKNEKEQKERAANVQKDLAAHESYDQASSFVYTEKKLIAAIFQYMDIRKGSDKHGNFISILLHDIHQKPLGLQRIYDRQITKKDGSKTNKDFTWGMEKSGAHFVIGNLSAADRIIAFEGFATGASAFLAHLAEGENIAALISIDADNLKKVVDIYLKQYPDMAIDLGLDNDLWKQKQGKGNKGLLTGLDILDSHSQLKAWYPIFDKVDNSYQATDWNDLHKYAGLKEVYKQLKSRKSRLKLQGDIFQRHLVKLGFVPRESIMKEAKKAVLTGLNVGLENYGPREVLSLIKSHISHAKDRVDLRLLKDYATRIFKAKVRDAQLFRSFSRKYTDPNKCPEHVTYTKFNQSVIDEKIYNHVIGLEGIVIVRMPMGSGKTQQLLKPAMHTCKNAAAFCHRTSLVGGSYEEFNQNLPKNTPGVVHYQDKYAGDLLSFGGKLVSCINSALKPMFSPVLNDLNGLFVDEASQTLRHTTAGGAVKYPVAVFNKLLNMISKSSDHVILADADANDTLVEFCELALKSRNKRLSKAMGEDFEPQKIHIIDGVTDCSNINILHTDSASAFSKATQDVMSGHKTLIANDSADDAHKILTYLEKHAPKKKGLLVTMDTKQLKDVQAFLDSPNTDSLKYDYIIYSPAISSGVSITNGHFKKHYGIFCGTVTPSDAIQMIRRDRKAREFILGLSTKHSSRESDPLNMRKAMILANDNNLDIELDHNKGAILLKTQDLEFDRFRLELITQENRAKNDFANNMLYMLFSDGYKLNALDVDELEKERGQMNRKDIGAIITEQEVVRHLEQETPSKNEYEKLEAKANLSKDERAKLNRWEIENKLLLPVNEDTFLFHKNGGLKKVKLMELLQMTPDKAKEIDDEEIKNGIQPSIQVYAAKQQKALREFFEISGISWINGSGQATEESLRSALEHLTTGDNKHLFNNVYRFGGFIKPGVRRSPEDVFKSICEGLGVKVERKREGRHNSLSASRARFLITQDSWQEMIEIQSKRHKAKISAFKAQSLGEDMVRKSDLNYIENDEKSDRVEVNDNGLLSWEEPIKQALGLCGIPFKNAKKVMQKIIVAGVVKKNTSGTYIHDRNLNIFEAVSEIIGQMSVKEFDYRSQID